MLISNINLNEIWKTCKEELKIQFKNSASVDFFLENSTLQKLDSDLSNAIITVESEFIKTIVESEFYRQIKESMNLILNSDFKVVIMTKQEYEEYLSKPTKIESVVDILEIPNETLNSTFLFENFVVSNSNKTLYSAALSVSIAGGGKWNPLFIYGRSGLGKTHLLHSIGNEMWKKHNNKRIKYIEARDFSKIVHEAKQSTNIYQEFHNIQRDFEKYDLLLVDDIQFIATQNKTKEVFFNIFNYFITKQKQVVITSDQYPEELGDFEERFISRFKSGLIMRVLPPDIQTAKKIVKNKLEKHNFDMKQITDEAIEYISINFSENIRNLEGAINRILIENIQHGDDRKITLNVIIEIFKEIVKSNKIMSSKKIIIEVSKYFKINVAEIIGSSRKAEIMIARHISIYLTKTLLDLNLKEIGRDFNRDHSTIISSLNKIDKEKDINLKLSNDLNEIRKVLT